MMSKQTSQMQKSTYVRASFGLRTSALYPQLDRPLKLARTGGRSWRNGDRHPSIWRPREPILRDKPVGMAPNWAKHCPQKATSVYLGASPNVGPSPCSMKKLYRLLGGYTHQQSLDLWEIQIYTNLIKYHGFKKTDQSLGCFNKKRLFLDRSLDWSIFRPGSRCPEPGVRSGALFWNQKAKKDGGHWTMQTGHEPKLVHVQFALA